MLVLSCYVEYSRSSMEDILGGGAKSEMRPVTEGSSIAGPKTSGRVWGGGGQKIKHKSTRSVIILTETTHQLKGGGVRWNIKFILMLHPFEVP